ncbi:hypothetical protein [Nocardioides daphniae]|uniref:Alpha/beta hydrolase n=1 Tax=Nocardioides daphniae TaxID=402297 RepID=A0A4P7UD20_9ACTN|nr:hypothetical protein [Nocardioides daphniae]QCC77441.1 hypothetical protein E2C04_10070 [Nocardioides daphniae]GGD24216.1 hypothetical protein GCM10007231_24190 [Nocardioides daphniae]
MTRVGVLFVHGIGNQAPGSTLRSMGDALLDTMKRWEAARGGSIRIHAVAADTNGPTRLNLDWLRHDRTAIQVTLAESWWADCFTPPSLGQMLRWAPVVAWRALFRLWLFFGLTLAVLLVFSLIFTPAALVAMATLAALAILSVVLPILVVAFYVVARVVPGLRGIAKSMSGWLILADGDAYALVRSPVSFNAMRSRLVADLECLSSECDQIILVAHSQGSVIALETVIARPDLQPHTMFTLGSAIGLLRLSREDPSARVKAACPELRWFNLYSQLDPVSAGPIDADGIHPVEIIVQNGGEPWSAHTTYVSNVDQVIVPIMAAIGFAADGEPFFSTDDVGLMHHAMLDREHRSVRLGERLIELAAMVAASWVLWRWGDLTSSAAWAARTAHLPDWLRHEVASTSDETWQRGTLAGVAAVAGVIAYAVVVLTPLHSALHRRGERRLLERMAPPRRLDLAALPYGLAQLPLLALIACVAIHANHERDQVIALLATCAGAVMIGFSLVRPVETGLPAAAATPLWPAYRHRLARGAHNAANWEATQHQLAFLSWVTEQICAGRSDAALQIIERPRYADLVAEDVTVLRVFALHRHDAATTWEGGYEAFVTQDRDTPTPPRALAFLLCADADFPPPDAEALLIRPENLPPPTSELDEWMGRIVPLNFLAEHCQRSSLDELLLTVERLGS